MALVNDSSVPGVDGDAALAAAREAAGESLRVCAEFDRDAFNPLFVADDVRAGYADDAAMDDHFADVHAYVHLDLAEIELFTRGLFPDAERVRYLVTGLDEFTLVRVYADGAGVLLSLDPDAAHEAVIDAVVAVLEA